MNAGDTSIGARDAFPGADGELVGFEGGESHGAHKGVDARMVGAMADEVLHAGELNASIGELEGMEEVANGEEDGHFEIMYRWA